MQEIQVNWMNIREQNLIRFPYSKEEAIYIVW